MKPVPRRSEPVAADTPADAEPPLPATNGHAIVPADASTALAVPPSDPGLYAVLGLDPTASDADILATYNRRAAKLLSNGETNSHAMRELNSAVQVLGNPARRAEYDRSRFHPAAAGRFPAARARPAGPVRLPHLAQHSQGPGTGAKERRHRSAGARPAADVDDRSTSSLW